MDSTHTNPVQQVRQSSSVRFHPYYPSRDTQKTVWTSSKCLRLLRPLTSKFAELEKLATANRQISDQSVQSNRRQHEEYDGDGEWEPSHPRIKRKIRLRYTSKRKEEAQKQAQRRLARSQTEKKPKEPVPGELIIPTPFVAKHFGSAGSAVTLHSPPLPNSFDIDTRPSKRPRHAAFLSQRSPISSNDSSISKSQKSLELRVPPDLGTLLRATKPDHTHARGCGSLLSMCLQKIPAIVREEQKNADALNSDERYDAATQLYDELENTFANGSRGWRPLQQLTRAFYLDMISRGIDTGLIGDSLSTELYRTCHENGGAVELGMIFKAFVKNRIAKTKKSVARRNTIYKNQFLELPPNFSGRVELGLWEFCSLVEGSVSLDILSTEVNADLLRYAILATTKQDADSHIAARLLETVLLRAVGTSFNEIPIQIQRLRLHKSSMPSPNLQQSWAKVAHNQLVQNTLTSLLAIISATAIMKIGRVQEDEGIHQPIPLCYSVLSKVFISIQQHQYLSAQGLLDMPHLYAPQVMQVLISHLLLLGSNNGAGIMDMIAESPTSQSRPDVLHMMESMLESQEDISNMIANTISLILSMARFCGRAHGDKGFSSIKSFVLILTSVIPSMIATQSFLTTEHVFAPLTSSFLRSVAIESAMAFAEQEGLKEYFDWVSDLNIPLPKSTCQQPATESSCTASSKLEERMGKAFRWDNEIEEWIVKTPVTSMAARRAVKRKHVCHLSEDPHSIELDVVEHHEEPHGSGIRLMLGAANENQTMSSSRGRNLSMSTRGSQGAETEEQDELSLDYKTPLRPAIGVLINQHRDPSPPSSSPSIPRPFVNNAGTYRSPHHCGRMDESSALNGQRRMSNDITRDESGELGRRDDQSPSHLSPNLGTPKQISKPKPKPKPILKPKHNPAKRRLSDSEEYEDEKMARKALRVNQRTTRLSWRENLSGSLAIHLGGHGSSSSSSSSSSRRRITTTNPTSTTTAALTQAARLGISKLKLSDGSEKENVSEHGYEASVDFSEDELGFTY